MGLLLDVKSLLPGVSNVYLGSMPNSPEDAVCIYHSGGYNRDLVGSQVEEPTFMIKIRSTSYATGETVCNTIKDLLNAVCNRTINGNIFLLIQQMGDINALGRDENNRPEWSINFRCLYDRS